VTVAPAENESQVAYILRRYPCLTLQPAEPRVGSPGRHGAGLTAAECAMVQRFEPAEGCEGFFIARFLKVAAEAHDDSSDAAAKPSQTA